MSVIESIYSTKIRIKTVDAPFAILVTRTERQSNLRLKVIIKIKIGFLLKFDWYSSDYVDPV